jgi:predicted MFS family arabinose efflux permease
MPKQATRKPSLDSDPPANHRFAPAERRASLALAGIYAFRMLGLFMILPVLPLVAPGYADYTPILVGLAIGIYGLTQALLQIPFGALSDRLGRKPVIAFGLLVFALGSVVAALADSLWGLVIGRAIQGGGAVAAVVLALTADLTREEQRTKAMAIIGVSIGMSFIVSMVLGPVLGHWLGLAGIFWISAVLALAGLVVLWRWVPAPTRRRFHRDTQATPGELRDMLGDAALLRLDFGIFALHFVLTASFLVLPLLLRDHAALPAERHWFVYLAVMVASLVVMVPALLIGERMQQIKAVFVGAVLFLAISELLLLNFNQSLAQIMLCMVLFFAAFNTLEATLPSLVSKTAAPHKKGTALGVYSTSQFLGAFLGGALGGVLYQSFGATGVLLACACLLGLWLAIALTMARPSAFVSTTVHVGRVSTQEAGLVAERLNGIAGVHEAVVIADEGVAYLKVDRRRLDERALRAFSAAKA